MMKKNLILSKPKNYLKKNRYNLINLVFVEQYKSLL